MFNNLIGGGNTQSFKNYAQQATDIVTKNNSKVTTDNLPQQVPPPLAQQVPIPEPQVPIPEPQVSIPEPQVPIPEPQVPIPEPALEPGPDNRENNAKNINEENNNGVNNNLNVNVSNEDFNSLPKNKINLIAKLEMLKSVNEDIPVEVINALIYILSYDQKQNIFKKMREFIKNNDNIV